MEKVKFIVYQVDAWAATEDGFWYYNNRFYLNEHTFEYSDNEDLHNKVKQFVEDMKFYDFADVYLYDDGTDIEIKEIGTDRPLLYFEHVEL